MRLNIGCGIKIREGWTNIDITDNGQEIVSDIRTLPLDDNVAVEAEAIHVIEHFNVWEAEGLIKEWFRVLKPGGVLRVEFPEFQKVLDTIKRMKDTTAEDALTYLYGALYGDFKYENPYMTHLWCFQAKDIALLMSQIGFGFVYVGAPLYHRHERDVAVVGVKP